MFSWMNLAVTNGVDSDRSEDTNIVVSVTQCNEPDLTKRFAGTSIDRAVVEKQLVALSEF